MPDSCPYQNCPYNQDIAVIKYKLESIDQKIDSIADDLRDNELRVRALETHQARVNGMSGQSRWDFRNMMLIAMFILTLIGVVASFIKDVLT